jgi:hypothetical protein
MRSRVPFSSVLFTSALLCSAAVATAQEAAEEPAEGAAEAAAETAPANAWDYPQEVGVGGVRVALHEPMVVSYAEGEGTIQLRFPAEVTDAVGRVTWGAVEAAGRAHLDLGSRLIAVDGFAVERSVYPELDPELAAKATEKLPEQFPKELLLRLELLTGRPGAAPTEEAPTGRVSTRPPAIHVRNTPAVLIQIDGEPVMQQVASFPLEYVLNSAATLLYEKREERWLLLLDGHWATAKTLEGPWSWNEEKLPIVLTQLAVDHPRGFVRRYIPGTKRYKNLFGKEERSAPETVPEVIISEKAAELVLLHGDPLFMLIPKVRLMTVANTASDLFFHPRSDKYYLLVSGRWFQAQNVEGPWAEHYGALPDEFAQIPRDHGRAHVLWSVPGTPEAAEAAARAMLPERVFLHRRIQVGIRYEGKTPDSSPIEGAEIRKVKNTEDTVFDLGGSYYTCVRGAWFRSDDGKSFKPVAELSEKLATVPEASGAFHVNACRPDGAEEMGFRFHIRGPYRGVFLHKGVPVHGNGWDTNGMIRNANWYPMPRTYGENRWYDPIAGAFRPRSVLYGDGLVAKASEWSDYTASYGRVRVYADRYLQGGRRMFAYSPGKDEFDLSAPRPDVYATWAEDVLERDGLPRERYPLGDRSMEEAPEGAPVVAAENGNVYRLGENGVELFVKDAWITPPQLDEAIQPQLEALQRARTVTPNLRKWAAQRAAALPINPVVTPRE